jgi:hypothetical protein
VGNWAAKFPLLPVRCVPDIIGHGTADSHWTLLADESVCVYPYAGSVNDTHAPIDNPIASSGEDRLGRASIAHDLAQQVRVLDASKGLVAGVMGPWGYGKTSFVNLMREQFAENPNLTVIDFNPWMFSGAQQLTDTFFKEVAAELRVKDPKRFRAVADELDNYGDVLGSVAAVFGPIGVALFGLGRVLARSAVKVAELRRGGTLQLRQKVAEELGKLDQPIVVIIDDIDRLSTDEIRDIFKLVRLTASFPNLIYILAFDRERVERALDEINVPGRAYLEKIVQLGFDLPAIQRGTLQSQVLEELNRILGDLQDARFDSDRWPDVFMEIVRPMFANLRDVTRFAVSARPTLAALGRDIEFVDLVALEAIRVFRPEVFAQLQTVVTELTIVKGYGYPSRDISREKEAVERFIASAGDDGTIVRSLITRVFPAGRQYIDNLVVGSDSANRWRAAHQVAHIDWLSLYLNRVAPSELEGFRDAEGLLGASTSAEELKGRLDAIPPDRLEDVLDALQGLASQFPIEAVVPTSVVLENLIASIPDRPRRGMFDFNRPHIVVARVVLQLMKKLEGEWDRESAVSEVLPQIETLSSKHEFIQMVGHVEGSGHKLVSADFAKKLESDLESEILSSPSPNPSREWDAARVYHFASVRTGTPAIDDLHDSDLIRSLFISAKSTNTSQSTESRSISTQEVLWWDGLVKIVGDEDVLRQAAETLRATDGPTPLLELVDRYLAGWRPKSWDYGDAAE